MAIFSKESLETLRQRIDLVEVLLSHLELKRSGASYKGLCPFHDEKTPSFIVQKGDSHYHCFGCGAHGDAIAFLMNHQKMTFLEAVENLAQRFHVLLEQVEANHEERGPSKTLLKESLENACCYFQLMLLQTTEGHQALKYLYQRGIDLDFIKKFRIGFAPKRPDLLRKTLYQKGINPEIMMISGLLVKRGENQFRDFFIERITFPIQDPTGSVIGFSGRKFKEETFGGKYVNTPETPLFKKSRVLYGLNYCRKRIAKERKAIIVEGQLDTLRLIEAGFTITVAGQGTAFGPEHAKELINLGVNHIYLLLDGDDAGKEATFKIGNLFQKEGVQVQVAKIEEGSDPDIYLQKEGPEGIQNLLEQSVDYLTFLVEYFSSKLDTKTPAGKNEMVSTIAEQIRNWDHPLMVHESLRQLSKLLRVPENVIKQEETVSRNIYIKKSASIGQQTIDPDRILETDFIRWLLLMKDNDLVDQIARNNIQPEDLHLVPCRKIYQGYLECQENDYLNIAIHMDDAEGQLVMSDLLQKKVNKERAEESIKETVKKILDRNWMEKREAIKMKIQSGQCDEDEVLELAKKFDDLKRTPPEVLNVEAPSLL